MDGDTRPVTESMTGSKHSIFGDGNVMNTVHSSGETGEENDNGSRGSSSIERVTESQGVDDLQNMHHVISCDESQAHGAPVCVLNGELGGSVSLDIEGRVIERSNGNQEVATSCVETTHDGASIAEARQGAETDDVRHDDIAFGHRDAATVIDDASRTRRQSHDDDEDSDRSPQSDSTDTVRHYGIGRHRTTNRRLEVGASDLHSADDERGENSASGEDPPDLTYDTEQFLRERLETYNSGGRAAYTDDSDDFDEWEASQHRPGLRARRPSQTGCTTTHLDQDTSGNFDLKDHRSASPEPRSPRRRRKPSSKSHVKKKAGGKLLDHVRKEEEKKQRELVEHCRQSGHTACKGVVRRTYNPDRARQLQCLSYNDWGDCTSRFCTTNEPGPFLQDENGRPQLLGHPAARGCWRCYEIGIDCSMRGSTPSWPCDACKEDDEDCHPVLPPARKADCENCRKSSTLKCSFANDPGAKGDCEQCRDGHLPCVAFPRHGGLREYASLDRNLKKHPRSLSEPQGPAREHVAVPNNAVRPSVTASTDDDGHRYPCLQCQENKRMCSLVANVNANPPCVACEIKGRSCGGPGPKPEPPKRGRKSSGATADNKQKMKASSGHDPRKKSSKPSHPSQLHLMSRAAQDSDDELDSATPITRILSQSQRGSTPGMYRSTLTKKRQRQSSAASIRDWQRGMSGNSKRRRVTTSGGQARDSSAFDRGSSQASGGAFDDSHATQIRRSSGPLGTVTFDLSMCHGRPEGGCSFCCNAAFAITGFRDSIGQHTRGRTRLCAACVMDRIKMISCKSHGFKVTEHRNDLLSFDDILDTMKGECPQDKDGVCSLCRSKAAFYCSKSDSGEEDAQSGCGMKLCEECEKRLREVYLGDFAKMLRGMKCGVEGAEAVNMRADFGLFAPGGPIRRFMKQTFD